MSGPVQDSVAARAADGEAARLRARAVREPLLGVLSLVLEARVAAELGDAWRADRAVERAAEQLLELLP